MRGPFEGLIGVHVVLGGVVWVCGGVGRGVGGVGRGLKSPKTAPRRASNN